MAEEEKFSCTVIWRMVNIRSANTDLHSYEIESPVFPLNNLGENEWTLCFLLENPDELNVCLRPFCLIESVSIATEWSLLCENGSPLLTTVNDEYKSTSMDSAHYMFHSNNTGNVILNRNSLFLSKDTLTVRLRIWQTSKDFNQPAEYVSIVTLFLEEPIKESFVWRIEKFSTLQLDMEAVATVCLGGQAFKLSFFLTGESVDNSYVNFGIVVENVNLECLKVGISFLDKDEKHKRCAEEKHKFNSTKLGQTWVVSKLASRREILEAPSDWLRDDNLVFRCEFECALRSYTHSYIDRYYYGPDYMTEENFSSCKVEKNCQGSKQCPRTIISTISSGKVETSLLFSNQLETSQQGRMSTTVLGENLLYFYIQHILTDYELRVGDLHKVQVHKLILSARSPVFRVMISSDMEANSMVVTDLDVDTLRLFLTFLYTGTVDHLQWEKAAKLYYAAHKYEVPSLKLECSRALRSDLNASNVCDILELADRHKDQQLTSDVYAFIQEHFDEIVISDTWEKFLDRSLLGGKAMREIHKLNMNLNLLRDEKT